MSSLYRPTLGISLGDINGIGPEIVIKTLADERILEMLTPVIYGSSKVLSYYRKVLKGYDFQYKHMQDKAQPDTINVVNCWQEVIEIQMGQETADGGRAARLALLKAAEDLQAGLIEGVVTAPISKLTTQAEDFNYPGHTEFFTKTFNASDSLMFLCTESLRVGVVSGHIPIKEVAAAITPQRVQAKLQIMEKSLREDFGIGKPRIAVLGLNPHAGENGLLGKEETEIIEPVIQHFREKGKLVFGPFPADGFFGTAQYKKYDATLAMYHDQGLIPFKTLAFEQGVNFTAGLPIVRTSPDHGTAFDICGKGIANERSFREALYLACDIVRNRQTPTV